MTCDTNNERSEGLVNQPNSIQSLHRPLAAGQAKIGGNQSKFRGGDVLQNADSCEITNIPANTEIECFIISYYSNNRSAFQGSHIILTYVSHNSPFTNEASMTVFLWIAQTIVKVVCLPTHSSINLSIHPSTHSITCGQLVQVTADASFVHRLNNTKCNSSKLVLYSRQALYWVDSLYLWMQLRVKTLYNKLHDR
jgi:hypothetical protein